MEGPETDPYKYYFGSIRHPHIEERSRKRGKREKRSRRKQKKNHPAIDHVPFKIFNSKRII
jgi:hypothetical protein